MPATIGQLELVFSSVVEVALVLAGIATLVMLLVGGFQFLTAGGDKEATQKAQKLLTYAIGGLLLTLAAWLILSFLGNFLGLSFVNFQVCLPGTHLDKIVGSPTYGGCINAPLLKEKQDFR